MSELKSCPWCNDTRGKAYFDFSVFDENFGQWVSPKLIKYCPFCGRKLLKGGDGE